MKWPLSIELFRHAQSVYNALRAKKNADPEYQEFVAAYNADFQSSKTQEMAERIREKYSLNIGDYETPLTEEGERQAEVTGKALAAAPDRFPVPDVIFYSPYLRARQTLWYLSLEWSALRDVKQVADDRIREQEHGLALLYNDWRVFHVFHPEQRALRELLGPYWYQYPQGESASQVRDRTRSFSSMLVREWAEKHVLVITHHLTILSFRANYERLTPEEFIHLDEEEKPANSDVTVYRCDPSKGKAGRLVLETYNEKFY